MGNIRLPKKFLYFFNVKELEDIIVNASAVTEDCIILSTKDCFYEISVDMGEKLNIYRDDYNGAEEILSKNEFLKTYRSNHFIKLECIVVDK